MDPANGAVDDSNREFQDTATYTCDTGFELFGNSMRTCQADGTWSGDEPTCRGKGMPERYDEAAIASCVIQLIKCYYHYAIINEE